MHASLTIGFRGGGSGEEWGGGIRWRDEGRVALKAFSTMGCLDNEAVTHFVACFLPLLSVSVSLAIFLKVEKGANQAVSGCFLSQGYGRLITQAFNVQSVMGCEGISWAREAAMLV